MKSKLNSFDTVYKYRCNNNVIYMIKSIHTDL